MSVLFLLQTPSLFATPIKHTEWTADTQAPRGETSSLQCYSPRMAIVLTRRTIGGFFKERAFCNSASHMTICTFIILSLLLFILSPLLLDRSLTSLISTTPQCWRSLPSPLMSHVTAIGVKGSQSLICCLWSSCIKLHVEKCLWSFHYCLFQGFGAHTGILFFVFGMK